MKPAPIPCGNLIEGEGGSCLLEDHEFPRDCSGCAAYIKGLNEQERMRGELWSAKQPHEQLNKQIE